VASFFPAASTLDEARPTKAGFVVHAPSVEIVSLVPSMAVDADLPLLLPEVARTPTAISQVAARFAQTRPAWVDDIAIPSAFALQQ
jgi:hypothetical protein